MTTVSIQPLLDRIRNLYQAGYAAGYQAACRKLTAALDLTALDLDDELKPTKLARKPAIEAELIETSTTPNWLTSAVNSTSAELTPTQAKAVAHVQKNRSVTAWSSRHICSATVFETLVRQGVLEKRGAQLFPLNSAS